MAQNNQPIDEPAYLDPVCDPLQISEQSIKIPGLKGGQNPGTILPPLSNTGIVNPPCDPPSPIKIDLPNEKGSLDPESDSSTSQTINQIEKKIPDPSTSEIEPISNLTQLDPADIARLKVLLNTQFDEIYQALNSNTKSSNERFLKLEELIANCDKKFTSRFDLIKNKDEEIKTNHDSEKFTSNIEHRLQKLEEFIAKYANQFDNLEKIIENVNLRQKETETGSSEVSAGYNETLNELKDRLNYLSDLTIASHRMIQEKYPKSERSQSGQIFKIEIENGEKNQSNSEKYKMQYPKNSGVKLGSESTDPVKVSSESFNNAYNEFSILTSLD